MKMEQQNTNGKEGVEVLQQAPFEDEELGEGQLTSKVYHLQRFVCINLKSSCFVLFKWASGLHKLFRKEEKHAY